MKAIFTKSGLILSLTIFMFLNVAAQTETPTSPEMKNDAAVKSEKPEVAKNDSADAPDKNKINAETNIAPTEKTSSQTEDEATSEGKKILAYYQNYLTEYRLGPNDVISVEVFGQCPDYCKTDITVPPTARISYPLIREGVMVGGRTTLEIQDEITKKLDEYIIDPKVTVSLVKAVSVRYSVMGQVAQPGLRVMDRKVSVYEAVLEAGGLTKDGNDKNVSIIRYDQQGNLTPMTVDLSAIQKGKAPMIYLDPGDQVFVPKRGFRFTVDGVFKILERASLVRLLLGSPF